MGYTKNTWIDRIVQFPRRFRKQNESAELVELTPEPGTVTAAGTPVNAALLNHMEQGIKDALPKDGSEPMTGPLQAPRLILSDYGTPVEIGRYIDLHKAGSSSDFDARITITDDNQFRFEPAGGSGWELRNNNGLLEVNAGGEWIPVGGATYVASNNIREQNPTEYIPRPNNTLPLYQGTLIYKLVPRFTGEVVISAEARGYQFYYTDTEDPYWMYFPTTVSIYAPSVRSVGIQPTGDQTTSPVGVIGFDYRSPLGTSVPVNNTGFSGLQKIGEFGSTSTDYSWIGTTLTVQAGVPIYFFVSCGARYNGEVIYGAPRYFSLRNFRVHYDIK